MIFQAATIATSITLASIPNYNLPLNQDSILEEQVTKNYPTYEFDGIWAQKQHGDKKVSYFNDEQSGEEVIAIYKSLQHQEGILTIMSREPGDLIGKIQEYEVKVIKQGDLPWEDLYEHIEEIPVSTEEDEGSLSYFIFYKWLLLEQKNK